MKSCLFFKTPLYASLARTPCPFIRFTKLFCHEVILKLYLAHVIDCNDNYSPCSQACGGGWQYCFRHCQNGEFGGIGDKGCNATDELKFISCNTHKCGMIIFTYYYY